MGSAGLRFSLVTTNHRWILDGIQRHAGGLYQQSKGYQLVAREKILEVNLQVLDCRLGVGVAP